MRFIIADAAICVSTRLNSWPPSQRMAKEFRRRAKAFGGEGILLAAARTTEGRKVRLGDRVNEWINIS